MISAVAIIPTPPPSERSALRPLAPLLTVGGEPRIVHALRRARQARTVSHAIVVTDSPEVARAVARDGGDCVMAPASVASNLDRVAIVAQSVHCELIVGLPGDEPLVDAEQIDRLVDALRRDSGAHIATMAVAIENESAIADPNTVKVVTDDSGHALYFSRCAIPFRKPGTPTRAARKHIGIYAYRRDALLRLAMLPPHPLELAEGIEPLRALAHGMRIQVVMT